MSFGKRNRTFSEKPSRIDVTGVKNPKLTAQKYNFAGTQIGIAKASAATSGKTKPVKLAADPFAEYLRKEWKRSGAK